MFTNLAQSLLLELTNPLAREVVFVADLLERELVLVVEPEAPPDDARFDGRQRREQAPHLVIPLHVGERLVRRQRAFVLEKVDELASVLVAHRPIEGERRLGPRPFPLFGSYLGMSR